MSRINAIERRTKAATAGPWAWEYGVSLRSAWGIVSNATGEYILRFAGPQDITAIPDPEDDMLFLQHAREDLPYLLDLVERAEALIVLATTVWLLDSPRGRSSTAEQWLRDVRGEDA